jgi:hypothetical protein
MQEAQGRYDSLFDLGLRHPRILLPERSHQVLAVSCPVQQQQKLSHRRILKTQ